MRDRRTVWLAMFAFELARFGICKYLGWSVSSLITVAYLSGAASALLWHWVIAPSSDLHAERAKP